MKNEKKFKERISSLAAMIAEGNYEGKEVEEKPEEEVEEAENPNQSAPIDADKFNAKLDTYDQALKSFYSAINNAQELELALVHIIEKMPNLKGNAITGMRRAIDRMAKNMADKNMANSNDVPDVTADDEKAAADVLPKLQEAFNRINRK
jgi:hypothetical protein